MIGKLKGVVDSYGEDFVILDVHGVGYVVHCSSRTLQNLPSTGEAAVLSIETHVREDMIRLFGFRSDAEREWFRLLQSVQGVGSKVALGILSVLDPGSVATAIATGDKASVGRAPGVGPKLAQRIVHELKDKVGALALGPAASSAPAPGSAGADAVSALLNLGFRPGEAAAAVGKAEAELGPGATLDALVRTALKKAAK